MHSFQCSECRLEPQAAPREAQSDGWKLVPVEPTDAMLEEITLLEGFTHVAMSARYKAMLAAAPTPERADADTAVAKPWYEHRAADGTTYWLHTPPASQERADAGKDATLTRWQKAQMAFGGGTTPEVPVSVASLARALTWALEWIDAVPEDTPLPAMPGFDRDYVNELLARVRATEKPRCKPGGCSAIGCEGGFYCFNADGTPKPDITPEQQEQIRAALAPYCKPAEPACWCETCRPITLTDMRMVLCPTCGNKRCPKATSHENACIDDGIRKA
jgi:hypothetical protein